MGKKTKTKTKKKSNKRIKPYVLQVENKSSLETISELTASYFESHLSSLFTTLVDEETTIKAPQEHNGNRNKSFHRKGPCDDHLGNILPTTVEGSTSSSNDDYGGDYSEKSRWEEGKSIVIVIDPIKNTTKSTSVPIDIPVRVPQRRTSKVMEVDPKEKLHYL